MKFTSTNVATEIFSGDFCDYELKPDPYVTKIMCTSIAAENRGRNTVNSQMIAYHGLN
jgi:hypothetical protein